MKSLQVLPLFYAFLFSLFATVAVGDGGAVVFSGEQGTLRVTVFIDPVPPRVGPVDLSVLVQDAQSLEVINAYKASASLTCSADATIAEIKRPLDRTTATNRLFQAVLINLPAAGTWQVTLEIEQGGVDQKKDNKSDYRFTFPLEIAAPQPQFWDVLFWILLPAIPLLLFLAGKIRRVVHEMQ